MVICVLTPTPNSGRWQGLTPSPNPEANNMENNALFPVPLLVHLQPMPQTLANIPLELMCREFPKINTDIFHQSFNSRLTGILR